MRIKTKKVVEICFNQSEMTKLQEAVSGIYQMTNFEKYEYSLKLDKQEFQELVNGLIADSDREIQKIGNKLLDVIKDNQEYHIYYDD